MTEIIYLFSISITDNLVASGIEEINASKSKAWMAYSISSLSYKYLMGFWKYFSNIIYFTGLSI